MEGIMRFALLSWVMPLSACFAYTPLETVVPTRGSEVVANLSAPLEVRVGELTVHDVKVAHGRVAYADADSLVLSGTQFVSESGAEYGTLGTPITVPRRLIAQLSQRRVSAWKTALALGAGGAAIAAIVVSVGPLSGSSSGGGPGKPPPSVRAP